MLHLDTSTVVAYLRGDQAVAQKLATHAGDLAMSSLVLAELLHGASISARQEENTAHVKAFRSQVALVDFDEKSAEKYAEIRVSLRRRGLTTGETDALIAAVALAHEATVVTHNVKHFESIEGLAVEDWVQVS